MRAFLVPLSASFRLTSGITLTLINEAAIKVSILPLVAIGPDCDEKEIELLFRNRQYELG